MTETKYPRIGETVLRETLSNGLRVCVVRKPGYRKRYAFYATHYGGMDMKFRLDGTIHDTPAGIAHYLEHKMFDTEDGNAMQLLSRNGADPNAFTANTMTAYYFDCTEHFAENLRVLLSFVSVPWFTQESVDKERGIIEQEIRMTEDTPGWRIYKNLLGCLYHTNPARVPIAGSVESIQEITPDTLYACHRAFYAPSNMILCVVGDLDPEEVLKAASDIVAPGSTARIERDYGPKEDPGDIVTRSITCPMEIGIPQFLTGFKCDAGEDGEALLRQDLIGSIACDMLFGDSSPLYERLYSDGLINGSFGGSYNQLPGASFLYAGGECKEPERVISSILEEASRLCAEGLDESFYQQIRRANFGSALRSLNSFENIAVNMADGAFRGFDAYRFPELFDSITKTDVEAFLRANVTEEHMASSFLVPGRAS